MRFTILRFLKINCLILSFVFPSNAQSSEYKNIQILSFKTRFGVLFKDVKDSTWDLKKTITLPAQPTFISITIKPNGSEILCLLKEPVKMFDTLQLDKSNTINFFNLQGGNYELIFFERNTNKTAKLNFSIEPVFWEKWWFSPFVFLVLSIILGLIFYFFYLIRLRQQLRLQAVRHELEIKALRAQMNPHFIFNSMNTIDAYILRKRFIEASDCLQKFSKLIRQILENSENQTISVAQELETLKLYIELEQERFSHSFSYQFDIQPELLEKDYQIPPLLIQPFIENAILHGIRHLTERKGEILLNLSISESLLLCVITDNGIGRKASFEINKQRQESHKSMGVDITMERISSYQTLYGDKMETNITDFAEGTRVEIKLPLILV